MKAEVAKILGVVTMTGVVVAVSVVLFGQVEAAAPADVARRVERWVRLLDSDRLADREAAEKALIEVGPDALGLLPRITADTPAEVKIRLQRITQVLETRLAESTARAAVVSLKGEMSLPDALDALEQQTGNRVVGAETSQASVDVELEKVPYWHALDQLLDQAQLTINPYGGQDGALTVERATDGGRPRFGSADYQGPFRFEPTRIVAVRDLRNPQMQVLRIQLETSWEPRVRPIALSMRMSEMSAVDDQGNEIAVDNPEATLSGAAEGGINALELQVPLQLPARGAERIKSLKGTLTTMIPGRVEQFEFSDLPSANEAVLRKAGVTVVLEQLRKNLELYEVRMRVQFDDAGNALESHRRWVRENDAFMLDDQDQRVDNIGIAITRQEANATGVRYLFDLEKDPKSYKFVYKTPALIISMPVKFELKDIILP